MAIAVLLGMDSVSSHQITLSHSLNILTSSLTYLIISWLYNVDTAGLQHSIGAGFLPLVVHLPLPLSIQTLLPTSHHPFFVALRLKLLNYLSSRRLSTASHISAILHSCCLSRPPSFLRIFNFSLCRLSAAYCIFAISHFLWLCRSTPSHCFISSQLYSYHFCNASFLNSLTFSALSSSFGSFSIFLCCHASPISSPSPFQPLISETAQCYPILTTHIPETAQHYPILMSRRCKIQTQSYKAPSCSQVHHSSTPYPITFP